VRAKPCWKRVFSKEQAVRQHKGKAMKLALKLQEGIIKKITGTILTLDNRSKPGNNLTVRSFLGLHPRRKVLLVSGLLSFSLLFIASEPAGGQVALALAAGPAATPVNCSDPFAQGGGNVWDDLPPLLDPSQWIGYVFAQLCKVVATTFFTVANYAVQWGSGCNSTGGAGLDFFKRTPTTIWVDASRNDWAYYFYDGQFIGVALLVQFLWMASTFLWQAKLGRGGPGLEPGSLITRVFLGVVLTTFSASLLEWSLELCNDFNSLFSDQLTIFQANSFQVDKGGNIFNTLLAILAAVVAILLVMQMATRYIYIAFLGFIFPLSGILWTNPGTQGYARLFFGSWFATVFVQPLQLGVLYITSAMKDGARLDPAMAMLFGICGSFLALGVPRILNSVLGGSIPLNGRGLLFATTLVARSTIRAGSSLVSLSTANGGSSGGGGSGTHAPYNPINSGPGSGSGRLNPTPSPAAAGGGGNAAGYNSISGPNTALRGAGSGSSAYPSNAPQASANPNAAQPTGQTVSPANGQAAAPANSTHSYSGKGSIPPASAPSAGIEGISPDTNSTHTGLSTPSPLYASYPQKLKHDINNSGLTITLTRKPSGPDTTNGSTKESNSKGEE
jgi:hypothetical protein